MAIAKAQTLVALPGPTLGAVGTSIVAAKFPAYLPADTVPLPFHAPGAGEGARE